MDAFLAKGKQVEREFIAVLERNGYKCTASNRFQDMEEHWDLNILYDHEPVKVDVKGLKKVMRNDPETNENFHWVELVNVQGKWGWLYGEAAMFAFETEEYWLMVNKEQLKELIAAKCVKEKVTTPTLYKMYQRSERLDMLTLVKTIDLMVIADEIIKK